MRLLATISNLFLLILLSSVPTMNISAQSRVTVHGKVRDKNLKENLPGAVIILTGSSTFKTIADEHGEFFFVNVPDGTYKVKVTYINYKEYNTEVRFPMSGDFNIDIESVSKVMETV